MSIPALTDGCNVNMEATNRWFGESTDLLKLLVHSSSILWIIFNLSMSRSMPTTCADFFFVIGYGDEFSRMWIMLYGLRRRVCFLFFRY